MAEFVRVFCCSILFFGLFNFLFWFCCNGSIETLFFMFCVNLLCLIFHFNLSRNFIFLIVFYVLMEWDYLSSFLLVSLSFLVGVNLLICMFTFAVTLSRLLCLGSTYILKWFYSFICHFCALAMLTVIVCMF